MKRSLGPGLFFLILFSTHITAQEIVKDSVPQKDTTVRQKIQTIVRLIIKDTVSRKETAKDTLLEQQFDNKLYGFRQFRHETVLFAETPVKWHKADWLRLGVTVAATAIVMPFDQVFCSEVQSHQSHYYTVPVIIGRIYGSSYFTGTLVAVSLGYTLITHNAEAKKVDIELIQAGIYSEVITEVLKGCIGRASPNDLRGAFSYRPFNKFESNFESMPSGDATLAFAISIITCRHSKSTFLKILAFVPAAFTLFARIYQNEHWASDEVLGAAIGFGTGEWVVNLHEGKRHKINIPKNN